MFKGGKLGKPMYEPGGKKGLVMPFEIQGQEFSALNGGPQFKFSESVSFVVHCKDQKEVDRYWTTVAALNALADEGTIERKVVADALKKYNLDPSKPNPMTV